MAGVEAIGAGVTPIEAQVQTIDIAGRVGNLLHRIGDVARGKVGKTTAALTVSVATIVGPNPLDIGGPMESPLPAGASDVGCNLPDFSWNPVDGVDLDNGTADIRAGDVPFESAPRFSGQSSFEARNDRQGQYVNEVIEVTFINAQGQGERAIAPDVGRFELPPGARWGNTRDRGVEVATNAPGCPGVRQGDGTPPPPPDDGGMGGAETSQGVIQLGGDGGIFTSGNAEFFGSTGNMRLNGEVNGLTVTPSGDGYWFVAYDGGVFSFGDARFRGSMGGRRLAQPVVGMSRTPTGNGYWLVASDGGIFSFGDARFHGSTGAMNLARPIVGMATTPDGNGYWLVASDGGVFTFGNAGFHGSLGGNPPNSPIVDIEPSETGQGYGMLEQDGDVYTFGDFRKLGGGARSFFPFVDMALLPGGGGYWSADAGGNIFVAGAASPFFSTSERGIRRLAKPIVGIAATPLTPDEEPAPTN